MSCVVVLLLVFCLSLCVDWFGFGFVDLGVMCTVGWAFLRLVLVGLIVCFVTLWFCCDERCCFGVKGCVCLLLVEVFG